MESFEEENEPVESEDESESSIHTIGGQEYEEYILEVEVKLTGSIKVKVLRPAGSCAEEIVLMQSEADDIAADPEVLNHLETETEIEDAYENDPEVYCHIDMVKAQIEDIQGRIERQQPPIDWTKNKRYN